MLDKQNHTKSADPNSGDSTYGDLLESNNLSLPVKIKSTVNLQLPCLIGIYTYINFLKVGLRYTSNKFNTIKAWYCIEGIADEVKVDGTSVYQMIYR